MSDNISQLSEAEQRYLKEAVKFQQMIENLAIVGLNLMGLTPEFMATNFRDYADRIIEGDTFED